MPRFHLSLSFEANDQDAAQRVADQIRSFMDEGDFAPEHRDAKVDEPTAASELDSIYASPQDDAAVVAAVTALADEWEQSLPELREQGRASGNLSYANCTAMDLQSLRALLPTRTVEPKD